MQCSKRVVDPDYIPEPNGCGPKGGVSFPDNPGGCDNSNFKDSCDAHDTCYGDCGKDRESDCDDAFFNSLLDVCINTCNSMQCWAALQLYFGAVTEYGDSAYEAGQVEGCACCDC